MIVCPGQSYLYDLSSLFLMSISVNTILVVSQIGEDVKKDALRYETNHAYLISSDSMSKDPLWLEAHTHINLHVFAMIDDHRRRNVQS